MIPEAPEQPGDPTGVGPQQVWARPGTATLPPPPAPRTGAPLTYPPVPPPPAPAARRGRVITTWFLVAVALLLAIAAVVMSVIKLTAPTPAATTTTMTAPPPTYSPQEAAAAKKEACDASAISDAPMTAADQAFVATLGDRGSDRYRQMLSNLQTVTMVETDYMRSHVPPATPKDVADAINDDINALIALVEANTRELPDNEISAFVTKVHSVGERVGKVCE